MSPHPESAPSTERTEAAPDGAGIATALAAFFSGPLRFRLTAYDGSAAGSPEASVQAHIATPRGLRYVLSAPGDLGLARAYLAGDLELRGVHPGDPYELFRLLKSTEHVRPSPRDIAGLVRTLGWRSFTPPAPPDIELLPRWRRALEGLREPASRRAAAVHAHYDLSNEFFEMILGPSMAYTCGVFADPDESLEAAQERKFELVARKLGLRPGMRLLDVGCGWGGMLRQAAGHGVEVVGVTLSGHQSRWLDAMLEREGLTDRATIWTMDYRSMPHEQFDAVCSIGMLEHIGVRNYPTYFGELAQRVRPGGRVLVHSITRADTSATHKPEPFTDRYVFPDGELGAPGVVITSGHDAGLELQHVENLRRSYPPTLAGWNANLVRRWDECVAEIGEPSAKVYGLYMAGSRLAFELGWLQVHQFLFTRPDANGRSGLPFRPDWTEPR